MQYCDLTTFIFGGSACTIMGTCFEDEGHVDCCKDGAYRANQLWDL